MREHVPNGEEGAAEVTEHDHARSLVRTLQGLQDPVLAGAEAATRVAARVLDRHRLARDLAR